MHVSIFPSYHISFDGVCCSSVEESIIYEVACQCAGADEQIHPPLGTQHPIEWYLMRFSEVAQVLKEESHST